jgi:hypothetical protein
MPRVQVPVFPCDFGARFCPQGISSASRGFGWRIHCGVEVTELSTNKQLSLTELRLLLLCISLSVSLRLSLLHGTSFADVPDVCVCVCTHTHTDTHRHTQTDTDRHTHTQTHRNLLCRRSWIPERVTCFQHQQRVLDNCSANLHSLTHFPSLPTAEIAAGGLRHRSRNMCASMACVVHLHQRYEHLPRAPPGRPASTRRPPRGTPCICSFRAGAGRCSPPRTPCMCSFRAGAGRCSPPRTPCMCSFRAGAGRCPPPHALLASAPFVLVLADARPPALLACAPLALVLADARPPALLACAPLSLVLADARPPALLASVPSALVRADARPPRTPCIGSSGAGAGRPARLLLRGASLCVGLSASLRRLHTPAAAGSTHAARSSPAPAVRGGTSESVAADMMFSTV